MSHSQHFKSIWVGLKLLLYQVCMGLVELSVLFYLTGLPSKAVVRSPTFSSGSASPINDDITVTKTSSSCR